MRKMYILNFVIEKMFFLFYQQHPEIKKTTLTYIFYLHYMFLKIDVGIGTIHVMMYKFEKKRKREK